MAIMRALDISASGMSLQRLRMDVISQNIANEGTTRTDKGTPYRRRLVVVQEQKKHDTFSQYLGEAQVQFNGYGVKAINVAEDQSPYKLVYDPTHPDADEEGYVEFPNVDRLREMVDMMSATRSYEANVTAFNASKSMAMKALDIGK